MDQGDELNDQQYAMVGRIVVCVAAAESITSKLVWHFAYQRGEALDPAKLHRKPMAEKLKLLRQAVPRDGSRTDKQVELVAESFAYIEDDRHALVHGFPAASIEGPLVLNLRQNHHVWIEDLPALCTWARHLRNVTTQMYVDATRGIYLAEADMPSLDPLPQQPRQIARKGPLGTR